MERQQKGNWTLEDIKGALMDDIKAMMQNELRQTLAGLMPHPAAAPTLSAAILLATYCIARASCIHALHICMSY